LGCIFDSIHGAPTPEDKIYVCIRCENQFNPKLFRDLFLKSKCACGGKYFPLDEIKWVDDGPLLANE